MVNVVLKKRGGSAASLVRESSMALGDADRASETSGEGERTGGGEAGGVGLRLLGGICSSSTKVCELEVFGCYLVLGAGET